MHFGHLFSAQITHSQVDILLQNRRKKILLLLTSTDMKPSVYVAKVVKQAEMSK